MNGAILTVGSVGMYSMIPNLCQISCTIAFILTIWICPADKQWTSFLQVPNCCLLTPDLLWLRVMFSIYCMACGLHLSIRWNFEFPWESTNDMMAIVHNNKTWSILSQNKCLAKGKSGIRLHSMVIGACYIIVTRTCSANIMHWRWGSECNTGGRVLMSIHRWRNHFSTI